MAQIKLYPHQRAVINDLQSGNILVGSTGSGKSITALWWIKQKHPKKKIYIITTAKKRDSKEWEKEAQLLRLKVIVDSWNNIHKYTKIKNVIMIFDEQRLIGSGLWARSFIKISKNNIWLLLTATPGDSWMDYIPVFIANGFYKNRSHFIIEHVIYSPWTKYPQVKGYLNENLLQKHKKAITVEMNKYISKNIKIKKNIYAPFNKEKYNKVQKELWNPFENRPINNAAILCYCLRRMVNDNWFKLGEIFALYKKHRKVILFYNFNYERDLVIQLTKDYNILLCEHSGHSHDDIPDNDSWIYMVQYASGAEGWNCTETNCIIFMSLPYSYKTLIQAEGRIDRLNTPYNNLYYFYLMTKSTIDNNILKCLKNKQNFNEKSYFNSYKKHGL